MADFEKAVETVFLHEGFLSDDKDDVGGITNFGISLAFLLKTGELSRDDFAFVDINADGKIDAEDIKALKKEDAKKLYKQYFWVPNNYELIYDQNIAKKIFDLAVNMGTYSATICAQRAVRAAIGLNLIEDGRIGHASITALNMCKPEILMPAIKSEAAGYYRSIKNPNASKYIKGWLRRAYDDIVQVKK